MGSYYTYFVDLNFFILFFYFVLISLVVNFMSTWVGYGTQFLGQTLNVAVKVYGRSD